MMSGDERIERAELAKSLMADRQDATIRVIARIVHRLINIKGKPYLGEEMLADAAELGEVAGIPEDDGAAEMASWR